MDRDDRPQLKHQIGRYRIVASLGQGGMGTIWLAVASGLGEFRKLLVIKELRQDLTRNQRFVEMFLDEAKLAARLNHPNVVHTLEAGQDGERYFLSMEFLDGQPLSELMQRATVDPRISLPVRLRILCDVLSGLHHAHELRDYDGSDLHIVHRDVSPQNVFVTYDGQVKVVDFGVAKAADAGNVTQPGVFKGKFSYAAPEQVAGQLVDRRADVFSVGVLLWELVSLKRFAKGKLSQAAVNARLAGSEPRLSEVAPDADELLCEICERALEVDPAMRFASADELRVALEQYLMLSGERVDASALAAVMRATFGAERAAMHRTIDARLKDSEFSESMVRQLRPLPSDELSEEDPTKVGDLSELVESSRNASHNANLDEPTSTGTDAFGRALRKGPRARWGAGLAIGLVFALIVFAIVREPRAPRATTAVPAGPPGGAPTAEAAPAPVTVAPAAAQAPNVQAAIELPPAAPPAQQRVQAAEPAGVAQRLRAAAVRARREVEAPAPELQVAPGAGAEERERSARPASGRERSSASLASVDDDAPELGTDLRQLPKAPRRKLDTEDPFQ